MKKEHSTKTTVPTLKPIDFDDYLFGGWKAPVGSSYSNFHIERIENYRGHLKLPVMPHRRSVFHFLFVSAGKIKRTKLLNQYEVLPNHFFFMPADTTTSIDTIADDTTGFYCHFKSDIFQHSKMKISLQEDFPFFQLIANPLIAVEDASFSLSLLQMLEKEYRQDPIKRNRLIGLLLLTLLTEVKLSADFSNQHTAGKNTAAFLTMRFKKALAELIYKKTKVREYAEYLAVSPNHLNKAVKKITGKSARQLLAEMKIMEAKVLLRQSSLSIGEIAYKLGQMDQSDFSRFFKSKTELTPNQYRHQEP